MKKAFNKLVRDNIPEIIKSTGGKPFTRTAEEKEMSGLLKEKILEEAEEFLKAKDKDRELAELIDILEAVNAYIKLSNLSVDDLEVIRKRKLKEHGGFKKRVVLERVE